MDWDCTGGLRSQSGPMNPVPVCNPTYWAIPENTLGVHAYAEHVLIDGRAVNAGSANAGLVPDRRNEAQEGVYGTIVNTLVRSYVCIVLL
jgi:hypothetical protein